MNFTPFTGALDPQPPQFVAFSGELDSDKPQPVVSDSITQGDPMGSGFADTSGAPDNAPQAGGGRGFVNPPAVDAKRDVGFAEAAGRGWGESGAKSAKYIAAAATAVPVIAESIINAVKQPLGGKADYAWQDAAFRQLVDPAQNAIDYYSLQHDEQMDVASKIAHGVGGLLQDLPAIIASGGLSGMPTLAAKNPGVLEFIGSSLSRGFDAMRPIILKAAGEKADQVLQAGGSHEQAVASALTAGMWAGVTGAVPMSMQGNRIVRAATGLPVGISTGEAGRVVQNAVDPAEMQAPFDPANVVVEGVQGSMLAAAMPGHAQPRRPQETAARVMEAGTVDEAIATATKESAQPSAPSNAVRAQMLAVRPLATHEAFTPTLDQELVSPLGVRDEAQSPEVRLNDSGTLTVFGDTKALQKLLKDAGVTSVLAAKNGVLVGKSQTEAAQRVLADFNGVRDEPSVQPEALPAGDQGRPPEAGIEAELAGRGIPTEAPPVAPEVTGREPAEVWFGRRGDGYQSVLDAEAALPTRQRAHPDLEWAVHDRGGRFYLAGYERGTSDVSHDRAVPELAAGADRPGVSQPDLGLADRAGIDREPAPAVGRGGEAVAPAGDAVPLEPARREPAALKSVVELPRGTLLDHEIEASARESFTPAEAAAAMRALSSPGSGMTVDRASQVVRHLIANWKNAPDVRVVARSAELPARAAADSRGYYDGRTVWVVASRNHSEIGLAKTLMHEAVAHHSLPEMMGPEAWSKYMRQILQATAAGNRELQSIRDEVRAAYVDDNGHFNLSPMQEANEIAARAVERAIGPDGQFRPALGFVKAAYSKIVEFLRGLGLNVTLTHAELQGALVRARRNLEIARGEEQGEPSAQAAARAPTYDAAVETAIRRATAGEPAVHGYVEIGTPSEKLRAAGVADLPLRTSAAILAKAHFEHGVPRSALKELPELLDHPFAVFDSDTVPGSFVVVTHRVVGEKPLIVAVKPSEARGEAFNFVPTLLPKDHLRAIQRWMDQGLMLWRDNEKSPEWFGSFRAPIARGSRPTQGSDAIVPEQVKPGNVPPEPVDGRTGSADAGPETSSGNPGDEGGVPPAAARDAVAEQPRERQPYSGPGAKLITAARDSIGRMLGDLFLKVAPMSAGSESARAVAKDFANAERLARWQWTRLDEMLRKNFTEDERRAMWEAADEENVERQRAAADPAYVRPEGGGLERLNDQQRAAVETLHDYGEQLLQRARDAGMFKPATACRTGRRAWR
jgi:hypothetical protein